MKIYLIALSAVFYICSAIVSGQIYQDPSAPVEDRVDDLLSRMTQDEKLNYIGGYNSFYVRAIPRLGLPALRMSDGPVGVRNYGQTTAYPAGILNAATWDTALVRQLGQALGKDCRSRGVHILLGPGMNIHRAPMCGRNFEYFGEDPYLAGQIAASYIRGVQQEGVSATAKHYVANNQEWDRNNVSSDMDERVLQEIYLPAFKAAVVDGKVGCVMSSYNLVNGTWATHNYHLLTETLKNDWGFSGVLMSDWGATHSTLEAAQAGLDLEMPSGNYMNKTNLTPYLASGAVRQSVIDDKVKRILRLLFEFGFYDRPQTDPSIPANYPPNADVALQLARNGIVLLKNQDNLLPLDMEAIDSIAVIGENAVGWISGGGSSWTSPFDNVTLLEGLEEVADTGITVLYDPGYGIDYVAFTGSVFYKDESGATAGLTAEYFNNKTLTGSPFHTKTDSLINFNWGGGAPAIANFPSDNFSVRWTGTIIAHETGDYEIILRCDDGGRVWIDDTLRLNQWSDHAAATYRTEFHMVEGEKYPLVVEYYENGGDAEIRFGYWRVDYESFPAADLAAKCDVAIVCVGFNSSMEGEGFDRPFNLPERQDSMVNAIARVNPNTIVVLNAGGNVATESWLHNVPVLLHGWYTGQEGGTAIAEILFGIVNPSGKLPVSFEKKWEDNPVYNSYYDPDGNKHVTYSEGLMLGYRYYDTEGVEPLFPFGFGLSYTTFEYSNLEVTPVVTDEPNSVRVSFDITNTGPVAGAEVAQLYIRQPEAPVERPYKELKGFGRVHLEQGETQRVTLALDSTSFSYFKTKKKAFGYDAGTFEVLVGSSSADIRLEGEVTLQVTDTIMPEIESWEPAGEIDSPEGFVEFSLAFSEPVFLDTGAKIGIYRYGSDTIHESIDIHTIAGLGTKNIRFTNSKELDAGEEYYIAFDSASFLDYHDNPAPGIKNKDLWKFHMVPSLDDAPEAGHGSLRIYPNPAGDIIMIDLPADLNGELIFDIHDVTGCIVDNYKTFYTGIPVEYNCSNLKNGLYCIRFRNSSATGIFMKD
jgi:beta-glucosidase